MNVINAIIKRDFPTFVAKAFFSLHGKKLKRDADEINYVDYLASALEAVATGDLTHVCVSIPPRHLKTVLGIALAAYALGLNPYTRILLLSYSERMAKFIASKIRDLMEQGWYKDTFETRLSPSRAEVMDFETTAGGGLLASWIGGGYTGRGADLLIIVRRHDKLTP